MRIGYLGPAGTYTEEAAIAAAANASYQPYRTIDAVFRAIVSGDIDAGLVPIENVIQGPVTETLDSLYHFAADVTITDMHILSIEHALGALGRAEQIKRVRSKDQALKQCSEYLAERFPDAILEEVTSTGAAIGNVVGENLTDVAAIGSVRAMEHYGLPVVRRNIGNVKNNKTRFVMLGPQAAGTAPRSGKDATSFVIYPPGDRIGILEDILSIISRRFGLSLSSIHSRPDTRGGFRFYMEVEGHGADEKVVACLDTLRETLAGDLVDIRVFGSYPRRPFTEQRIRTIGIVGGTGRMGQWLRRFFEAAGYKVLISGRHTRLDSAECVAGSDVVIVNVPIAPTLAVIRDVAPLMRPGQLIADNTSIKAQPVKTMLDSVAPGVEVLGMHTVFGPGAESVAGENVVFTRTRASGEIAAEFERIFYKHGARITHAEPDYHDRQMAFHQNLEHFSKLVLAEVMHREFGEGDDMEAYSSPNSRASLATMARILSADAELLREIQTHNLSGPAMLDRFIDVAQRLAAAMKESGGDAFRDAVEECRKDLGDEFLERMGQHASPTDRRS